MRELTVDGDSLGTVLKAADEGEPFIRINGRELTAAQSMAVRVAVSDFHTQMRDPEFAEELGPIAQGYADRLLEVLKIMQCVGEWT